MAALLHVHSLAGQLLDLWLRTQNARSILAALSLTSLTFYTKHCLDFNNNRNKKRQTQNKVVRHEVKHFVMFLLKVRKVKAALFFFLYILTAYGQQNKLKTLH